MCLCVNSSTALICNNNFWTKVTNCSVFTVEFAKLVVIILCDSVCMHQFIRTKVLNPVLQSDDVL